MKCCSVQIVPAPKETVKRIFIHLSKMAPLALCASSLEMNFTCPFSPLLEIEFRLSQTRGSKLCSSAAVRFEQIMPASEQQQSLLYLTCLCAKSDLIVLCYDQKKRTGRGCPCAVLFLFFNVKHVLVLLDYLYLTYLSYLCLSFAYFFIFPLQTLEIIYLKVKFYFFQCSCIQQGLCRCCALSTSNYFSSSILFFFVYYTLF